MIRIKRAYEALDNMDGFRILVDKLWPRGISKAKLKIDLWMKEIAPSAELRKWYNHEESKWKEFQKKYRAELKKNDALNELKKIIKKYKRVTLIYAAKDENHNNAMVLKSIL